MKTDSIVETNVCNKIAFIRSLSNDIYPLSALLDILTST